MNVRPPFPLFSRILVLGCVLGVLGFPAAATADVPVKAASFRESGKTNQCPLIANLSRCGAVSLLLSGNLERVAILR